MIRTQLVCPLSSVGAEEAALVAAGCRPGGEGEHPLLASFPLKHLVLFSPRCRLENWVYGHGTNRSFPRSCGSGVPESVSRMVPQEGEFGPGIRVVSQIPVFRGRSWELKGQLTAEQGVGGAAMGRRA